MTCRRDVAVPCVSRLLMLLLAFNILLHPSNAAGIPAVLAVKRDTTTLDAPSTDSSTADASLTSTLFSTATQVVFPNTYDSGAMTATASTPTTTAATTAIDASSASSIDASVSTLLAYSTTTDAIPIPSHLSKYDQLTQLASMMPALPTVLPTPNTQARRDLGKNEGADILAHLRPSWPSPSLKQVQGDLVGRDAPMRVMIVGDSMTHGAEGDFTWRYRIWEWFRRENVSVQFVGPYVGTLTAVVPQDPQPPPL